MKISELLSGPTIASSRVLSSYSTIVIAILWTETPPEKLPGIGSLSANPCQLYTLMLAVLIFMSLAHCINWTNDLVAHRSSHSMTEFQRLDKMAADPIDPVAYDGRRGITAEAASRAKTDRARTTILNRVLRYGMHFLVPVGLSIASAIMLMFEIWI